MYRMIRSLSVRTRRTVTIAVAISCLTFLVPAPASAEMECWPGGLELWYDGYYYCSTSGSNCEYCLVVDRQ